MWQQVGGYCENSTLRFGNEDWDFWLSAAEKGIRAARVAGATYYYRRYKGSMSIKLRKVDYLTRELIVRRHSDFFQKYGTSHQFLARGYLISGFAAIADREYTTGLKLLRIAVQKDFNLLKVVLAFKETFAPMIKTKLNNGV